MKNTEILGKINALLNRKIKLEQQALENGTVVEAESFEVGQPIFSVDGETKEPLKAGDYVMVDGSVLTVTEEGIIGEIASASTESVEEEVVMAEVPASLEEILTAVVDAIQPKLDELQAKIDALSSANTEMKATLSSASVKRPTTHKPVESKTVMSKMNSNINLSNTEALIMARLSNKN